MADLATESAANAALQGMSFDFSGNTSTQNVPIAYATGGTGYGGSVTTGLTGTDVNQLAGQIAALAAQASTPSGGSDNQGMMMLSLVAIAGIALLVIMQSKKKGR